MGCPTNQALSLTSAENDKDQSVDKLTTSYWEEHLEAKWGKGQKLPGQTPTVCMAVQTCAANTSFANSAITHEL